MADSSRSEPAGSSVVWQSLEEHFRQRIQGYLQQLLEAELEEFLGRPRYVRRAPGSPPSTAMAMAGPGR